LETIDGSLAFSDLFHAPIVGAPEWRNDGAAGMACTITQGFNTKSVGTVEGELFGTAVVVGACFSADSVLASFFVLGAGGQLGIICAVEMVFNAHSRLASKWLQGVITSSHHITLFHIFSAATVEALVRVLKITALIK
jgi:hypothetical protein